MAEVLRVSLYGQMPGGESWSINPVFHLVEEPTVTFSDLNTVATAIVARTIPADVRTLWSSGVNFNGARLEARHSNGVLEALVDKPLGSPVNGSGSGALTFQTAMVFSLRTNFPGGKGRGRLYVPATGLNLNTASLRPSGTVVSAALAGMKTWLSGIEADIETTLGQTSLAVWSRTDTGTRAVTKILAGDVLDTQRRRRDSLAENYSEVSYP